MSIHENNLFQEHYRNLEDSFRAGGTHVDRDDAFKLISEKVSAMGPPVWSVDSVKHKIR